MLQVIDQDILQIDDQPRPAVEYQESIQERVSFFPWEQEGVVHLQQVLNSQPGVADQDSTILPVIPYTSVWGLGEEEGQESLDLSTTSTIPSYTPHSSLTILHHRDDGVVSHHRNHGVVSHNREDGVVAHPSTEDRPVTSYRDTQTERLYRHHSRECEEDRLCKVCGEKAGKHSYYGGQVRLSLLPLLSLVVILRPVLPAGHSSAGQYSLATMPPTTV